MIFVENDAKVDVRCYALKIDIRYLKCTKFDAKEKEKEKKEKKEEKEKKEKIGMNLLKSPFFNDRKNRLHDEEIKLSNKRYGSYGDSSHPHDTKNLISRIRSVAEAFQTHKFPFISKKVLENFARVNSEI